MKVTHEFPPFFKPNSKILILGSIPSRKSREVGFYYGHPHNRFWVVLSSIFQDDFPQTIEDQKRFLEKHSIALWDVLASCTITNSSDASIKNIEVNDISTLLNKTEITHIYTTGKKAYQIYQKYIYPKTNIEAICLPSPSSANAAFSLEKLIEEYQIIRSVSSVN